MSINRNVLTYCVTNVFLEMGKAYSKYDKVLTLYIIWITDKNVHSDKSVPSALSEVI